MRAAGMVFRAQLRRQWRSWLGLCLLIAVISGVVLATATAGRRTDSAFPRFLARHGYGTIVYSAGPLQRLGRLPEVAQVTPVLLPFYGHLRCSCRRPIAESDFTLREMPPGDLRRVVKLVSGRMPDQSAPGEVLASFTLARDNGVRTGTVIRVAAGRAVWGAFAVNLGMVAVPVVPGWLIAGLAAGVLIVANAIAAVPAVSAARARPGQALRAE